MNIGLNITQKYNHFLDMIKSGLNHSECNFVNVSSKENLKKKYQI